VAPADADALAAAMAEILDHPQAPEILRAAVSEYRQEVSARRYLEALGLAQ
jgi:glycosyltransferase involved in cell wall biosynthesis